MPASSPSMPSTAAGGSSLGYRAVGRGAGPPRPRRNGVGRLAPDLHRREIGDCAAGIQADGRSAFRVACARAGKPCRMPRFAPSLCFEPWRSFSRWIGDWSRAWARSDGGRAMRIEILSVADGRRDAGGRREKSFPKFMSLCRYVAMTPRLHNARTPQNYDAI